VAAIRPPNADTPSGLNAGPACRDERVAQTPQAWIPAFPAGLPRATGVVLALGVGAIGAFYLLPRAGVAQCVVLCCVNLSSAVFASVRAGGVRGPARKVWVGLAAGQWLALLANAPYYAYPLVTGTALPFPTVVDLLFLATYPPYVFALWTLAKQRRASDVRGDLLDAMIVFVAGGSIMWTFALEPALHSSGLSVLGHVVAPMYPIMDLALFAMLAQLLVRWARTGALRLIVASFMALQVADLLYQIMLGSGTFYIGGPTDGLWMLSYVMMAAAASHPSGNAFARPKGPTSDRITTGRLVFLAAALLVGPILLAARHQDAVVLACMSALTLVLVVGRMAVLNWRLAAARNAVEQKTAELHHQALHDALTGLPNRALVIDRAEQMLARARRRHVPVTAMYVDIDDFKRVNDTLGHAAGDELLTVVAERMRSVVREGDTVGRMSGDEFVVLIDDKLGAPRELVPDRLLEVLRQPIELVHTAPGRTVSITASAGIATGEQSSADDLLREADFALYAAKAGGKNHHASFESRMQSDMTERAALAIDLARALQEEQLFLLYQPTIDLQNEVITGVEALLRWRHPKRGVITPDGFIPLAASTGLIIAIGRWVLVTACAQAGEWHRQGRKLAMSVNVSAAQLDDPSLVNTVRDALERGGLDAQWLTLEITETALMRDPDAAVLTLHALKTLGVQIAIDDFGTGYSSLNLLHQLPVDVLKIDRSFIAGIASSPQSHALVHTLLQLGKTLGLATLGEGIEDYAQLRQLQQEHCDLGQGFLFARPLPAAAIAEFAATGMAAPSEAPRRGIPKLTPRSTKAPASA
jgi:diguanylate cyclase (GGDEF)-like protein